MHRKQSPAIFDGTLVALRFVFGDAHANESSHQTTYGSASACTCECRDDWAGGDERTDSRDR